MVGEVNGGQMWTLKDAAPELRSSLCVRAKLTVCVCLSVLSVWMCVHGWQACLENARVCF